jgi:hypothetical protein
LFSFFPIFHSLSHFTFLPIFHYLSFSVPSFILSLVLFLSSLSFSPHTHTFVRSLSLSFSVLVSSYTTKKKTKRFLFFLSFWRRNLNRKFISSSIKQNRHHFSKINLNQMSYRFLKLNSFVQFVYRLCPKVTSINQSSHPETLRRYKRHAGQFAKVSMLTWVCENHVFVILNIHTYINSCVCM